MRIVDLLCKEAIAPHVSAKSKEDAIDQLIALMEKSGSIADKAAYRDAVMSREKQGSTGIGEEIAIPHGRSSAVKKAGLAVITVPQGVDFDSLDGKPAKLLFLIAAPEKQNQLHLDVLARLSTLLMDEDFKNSLLGANTSEEFLHLVNAAESAKFMQEEALPTNALDLVAVTACPTGIAHTYMAAEALTKRAQELGLVMKVETNGSGGIKNPLTAEDIAQAKGVIVAADREVEMERFEGKPVLITPVSDGIHKPGELIENAPSAPLYHVEKGRQQKEAAPLRESGGRKIYKALMNGVSHMLPFVVGGGILIALAFLADSVLIPNGPPASFGKNSQLAYFLKTVGETAFQFMLPVLAGYIAMAIGDRPALAVGFVGGMLAGNGGSGFFGALIAGFVGGALVLLLGKLFDKLPDALEGTKPVLLYPLFGVLLMGILMQFVINPPVSVFNNWLTHALRAMGGTSKVLFGMVLGGMMAIDYGGPLNKAAYVVGAASIAVGQPDIMAAVMVGGMAPPIALALATMFFKNRFTQAERQTTVTNFIMGASFITEGAIPFAAADPLHVIPSLAIGSAVAGGLSMFFGCTCPAPHGGIFVFPVVGNPFMYFVALATGSLVGCILVGLLKKPLAEYAKSTK